MTIFKKSIDLIERVYATAILGKDYPTGLLVASEGYGECKHYSLPELKARVVQNNPGGTTDLCAHPHNDQVFFAINNFVPVFQAEAAALVYVIKNAAGEWHMNTIESIPFLHRFDIFSKNGRLFFIGATLCSAKKDKEDWSSPGAVMTGILDETNFQLTNRKTILQDITKNHGLTRTTYNGMDCYLIAGANGAWMIPIPDDPAADWTYYQLHNMPTSDLAVCDIDKDGHPEIAFITPFHGNQFKIYKNQRGEYKEIYARQIEFGHVLWGGKVNGIPSFILGYRQGKMELLMLRYAEKNGVTETIIDQNCGPSQISCFQSANGFNILAANRKVGIIDGEVALYTILENGTVTFNS